MAVTCHLRNPETFAEQKAGLGSEERSRGRQPIKRAIRYNQEINLLYPCTNEIIHHRHYIPKQWYQYTDYIYHSVPQKDKR